MFRVIDCPLSAVFVIPLCSPESLKDLVAMEVDGQTEMKNELPTPPASDVGSPTSFSHCGSDSEPDSPMGEDTKVCITLLSYLFLFTFFRWL